MIPARFDIAQVVQVIRESERFGDIAIAPRINIDRLGGVAPVRDRLHDRRGTGYHIASGEDAFNRCRERLGDRDAPGPRFHLDSQLLGNVRELPDGRHDRVELKLEIAPLDRLRPATARFIRFAEPHALARERQAFRGLLHHDRAA